MEIIPYLCTMNYTKTNLNYESPDTIKLINSLVGKGTVLDWHQPIRGTIFKDNKGRFQVTSIKINRWGSIYINLRALEGRYFNKSLYHYFNSQGTVYKNNKEKDQFKYLCLRNMTHKKLKLVGYQNHEIFIKRLYL